MFEFEPSPPPSKLAIVPLPPLRPDADAPSPPRPARICDKVELFVFVAEAVAFAACMLAPLAAFTALVSEATRLLPSPSFRGQANGLWLWQHDVGSLIVDAIVADDKANGTHPVKMLTAANLNLASADVSIAMAGE